MKWVMARLPGCCKGVLISEIYPFEGLGKEPEYQTAKTGEVATLGSLLISPSPNPEERTFAVGALIIDLESFISLSFAFSAPTTGTYEIGTAGVGFGIVATDNDLLIPTESEVQLNALTPRQAKGTFRFTIPDGALGSIQVTDGSFDLTFNEELTQGQ